MRLSGFSAGAVHPSRSQSGIKALGIGAVLLLMATASACTAQSAASKSVDLLCKVEGAKLLSPGTTSVAVCGEIEREINGALSQHARTAKSVASISSADWIKIEVRFVPPATASATVIQRIGGREIAHPEIAVDVMDKPLGSKEVKLLAREVARAVVKATIHKE